MMTNPSSRPSRSKTGSAAASSSSSATTTTTTTSPHSSISLLQRNSKRKRKRSSRLAYFDENNDDSNINASSTTLTSAPAPGPTPTPNTPNKAGLSPRATSKRSHPTSSPPSTPTSCNKKSKHKKKDSPRSTNKRISPSPTKTSKPTKMHLSGRRLRQSALNNKKVTTATKKKSTSKPTTKAKPKSKKDQRRLLELARALCYNVNCRRVMSHVEVREPNLQSTISAATTTTAKVTTKQRRNSTSTTKTTTATDIFHQRYNELLAFKESYGHCNVPYEYKGSGLARWCKKQRAIYARMKENVTQISNGTDGNNDSNKDDVENGDDTTEEEQFFIMKKLDEIGFRWTKPKKITQFFPQMMDELKQYKQRHGHCDVPCEYTGNHQYQQLNNSGGSDKKWRNCSDSAKNESNSNNILQLGKFVQIMRRKCKERRINEDEKRALDDLGFVWVDDSNSSSSNNRDEETGSKKKEKLSTEMIREKTTKYVNDDDNGIENGGSCINSTPARNPNCNKLPMKKLKNTTKKSGAVKTTPKPNVAAAVPTFREQQIQEQSIMPAQPTKDFQKMIVVLKQYKQDRYDDFKTKYALKFYSQYDTTLGNFVNKMRTKYRKGILVPGEKLELDQVGFLWEEIRKEENIKKISLTKRKEFNEMVDALEEYKQIYGNCNVPHNYPANPRLVTLVRRMRRKYARGDLSDVERLVLDELGFSWVCGQPTTDFGTRMDELKQFKEEHGHCAVPLNNPTNQKLANFVHNMRRKYARKIILEGEQIELEKLGFIWKLKSGIRKTFVVPHTKKSTKMGSKKNEKANNEIGTINCGDGIDGLKEVASSSATVAAAAVASSMKLDAEKLPPIENSPTGVASVEIRDH